MKNYILLFLLVFILNEPLYSQNEGNNWYFGNKAGLSFNTDPPTPLTNGQLSTGEGCAAVSDLNGNLLFYTDGIYVYNKMHNVMPNGFGLIGHPSSTQSAIIVPQPGTYNVSLKRFNIYYIFTVDVCGGSDGVRYSIVDMTLDNGLGDITVKNVHLYGTTTTEKICATTHANGCDFWIIGKLRDNNTFYSYLLDNNGLQPPVISNTGPSIGGYHGYMKVSHNSQLIAIAHCGPGEGIHVYDFDNNTGNIILKFSDVPLGSTCYYGIEFSPDDNLLYFTALHSPNIYQYNLNVLDNLAFKSSLTIIGTTSNNPNPSGYILGALQIAKNNKIYAALIGKTSLGVINNPNIQGTGCNYTDFSQDLAGRTCQLGLPTFPSSYLVPLNYILFNDNRCVLEPVSFSLSDSTFINVQWYFYNINNPTIPYATSNDHHPNIIFNNHGSYIIKAVINYPCIIDTILDTISIFENPNISINVSSNNVCLNEGSELIVSSDIPGTTFNWSNGLGTNPNVTVSPTATNTYSVTGTTPEGCTGTAEVTVTVHPLPNITASATPSDICLNENSDLMVSSDIPGTTFSWSNGLGTNPSVTVIPTATTTYLVTGTTPEGCTGTAEVTVTVHPLPNITASATPSDICLNENSDLTVSSDIIGTTFSWSNGLGTNPNVTVSPTATTTYSVTGTTLEGCTGTAEVTVTVHPLPNITASATPSEICLNENSDLMVSSDIPGTTFSWSNGLGTNSNVTVSPTATNTYSVTGTTPEGCTGTAEVTVTVHPLPNITASATPSDICLNENSDLTVSSDIIGTTFSWSNGLGTNPNVTVSPTATTTYSVTGTTLEGCTGTAEVTVTVHPLPNITASATPSEICLNENSDLMVSSDIPGTTFSWSNGLGTNPSVTVSPSATTTYSVTGTTPEGCTGTAEVTVTVHPLPNISATSTPTAICLGDGSDLMASSDITGTTFNWSNGLGTSPNVTVSPTTTTTYLVTGTTSEGCTGTATVTVTVHPLPTITASATPTEICLNESSDLIVSSDITGTTFSWSNGLGTNPNVTVSPTATTTYSVTGTTPEGCTGTAEVTVTVHNLPNIDFLASPLSGCEPLLVSFINNSDNGTYYWYFGDGNSDNMHSPTHIYNNDGFYDIMLIVKNQYNCLDTLIKYNYITVYPSPISGFSISPTITTEVDGYVMIIDNSTGANSWYYDFGDNNNADIFYDREPMYRYTIADNYVITQIVANQYGCSDTSYNQVHVRPFTTYYLPNAFTPNDDGQNDFFNFSATNIEFTNFEMRIFDRWGKQIFFTTNPNLGWDGKYKGKLVPQGVYSYIINFTDSQNFNRHTLHGRITVIY